MGHREAAGDEVECGEMNDEVRRAHERVDDEDNQVETSEDETTTVTPHAPQSMSLEGEWIAQTSGHPDSDENAETRNSTRPPKDPGDATGDDARHPDEPTEPPNDAESARVRDGEERAEARWSRVSEASRGCADKTAESGGTTGARTESRSDEGVPGSTEDDPGDPGGGADRRDDTEVEPGGEAEVRQSECVAHENADAAVDEEVGEARRGAQVEGESAGMRRDMLIERERGSASALERSTTTDEENDQRPSSDDDDIPGIPPDPPEPPDVTVQRRNEPPSAELEGEWDRVLASYEAGPTAGETDVSGLPGGDEDPRNRPKAAQNTSERERERSGGRSPEDSPEGGRDDRGDPRGKAHTSGVPGRIEDVGKWPRKLRKASKRVSERSERRSPENSPSRPREEPEDPGGETRVPGSVQSDQEGPEGVRDERVDETNAPCRDTGPGGRLELQRDSRGVEVDRDCRKVVKGTEHHGKRPRSEEDERYVETNALCRIRGPGGHVDEEAESGDVGGERERESDGDGVWIDGIWCRMDGAMSGARCDSV